MQITEVQEKGNDLFYFRTLAGLYKVQYEFDDAWRVSMAVYQSHRKGNDIQRRVQRPRWKKLGYLSSRPTPRALDLLESHAELSGIVQSASQ